MSTLLQVCLNLHVSPFAQLQGVLKRMQIYVPAVVCVMLSDVGPSLEVMFNCSGGTKRIASVPCAGMVG